MAPDAQRAPEAGRSPAAVPVPPPGPAEPEIEGGFDRRVLRWVLGVAAVSLAGAIVLSAVGQEQRANRPATFANSYGYSALGHRAFVELLRERGIGVLARRSSGVGNLGPQRPLVLAEPASGAGEEELLRQVSRLVGEAGDRDSIVVLVLPKWEGKAGGGGGDGEWIASARLLPTRRAERLLGAAVGEDAGEVPGLRRFDPGQAARCRVAWESGREARLELAPAQLLALPRGEAWEPLVACAGGTLVARAAATDEHPDVVVVADPDLLNNQGLGRAGNAAVMTGLFEHQLRAAGAVFDETIHGFRGAPGLLAEALRFPMVLVVLHGALLLGLALWAGMGRFGKPLATRPGVEGGKGVLIDSTAELLSTGGDVSDSADRYYRQTLRAVAAAFGLPAGLGEGELRHRLQQITERVGVKFDLARCETTVRGLQGADRRARVQAVAVARRLYHWRMEMLNGNRESR